MKPIIPLALLAALTLQGCLAKTAWDVATLPVKAGSKAVDLATTSQSEADEKRGRELRKREERLPRPARGLRRRRPPRVRGGARDLRGNPAALADGALRTGALIAPARRSSTPQPVVDCAAYCVFGNRSHRDSRLVGSGCQMEARVEA